jgi:hypothetical protein
MSVWMVAGYEFLNVGGLMCSWKKNGRRMAGEETCSL